MQSRLLLPALPSYWGDDASTFENCTMCDDTSSNRMLLYSFSTFPTYMPDLVGLKFFVFDLFASENMFKQKSV